MRFHDRNGAFADYFVTAVRTGGKGMRGISFLLIERGPGITTNKVDTSYGGAAGTSPSRFCREDFCRLNVQRLHSHGLGSHSRVLLLCKFI